MQKEGLFFGALPFRMNSPPLPRRVRGVQWFPNPDFRGGIVRKFTALRAVKANRLFA